MRVHVADEFRDLRGQAMAIALRSLGHEVMTDPASAEMILCTDPRSAKVAKVAKLAPRAKLADPTSFVRTTPKGQSLLRVGGLLSTVLDRVKGIGVGVDEPMVDEDADIDTMLAILGEFVPPKKPLGLGFHLVRAAEALRRRERYLDALRVLELALQSRDDIRSWARGETTDALSSAL